MIPGFVISIFIFLVAGGCWAAEWWRQRRWHRASGRVLEIARDASGGAFGYAPVVEFVTASGRRIVFTHSVYSGTCRWSIGDKVDVLYDGRCPKGAVIENAQRFFPFALPAVISALTATLLGIVATK
jgi:hypothetical protein